MTSFPRNLPFEKAGNQWKRFSIFLVTIALVYFSAAKIGLLFVLHPEGIAGIWPASGVALAALLLARRKEQPYIAVTIFAVNTLSNLTSGNSFIISAGFGAANTLEAVLCAWGAQRFIEGQVTLSHLTEVVRFVLIIAVANAVAGLFGALVPVLGFNASYFHVWQVWWTEDSLGSIIVTPLILTFATAWQADRQAGFGVQYRRWAEMFFLLVLLGFTTWLAFGVSENILIFAFNPYMLFPILIWIGLRFRPRGITSALLLMAAIALGCTTGRIGMYPLGGETPADRLVRVQLFLYIASLTGLFLAVIVTDSRRIENRYRTLFEHANDAIFVEDEEDNILDVNRRVCEMLGYSRDELRSMKVNMLRAPELRLDKDGVIKSELQKSKNGTFESVDIRRDGSRVPIEVSVSRIGDAGIVFAIVRDITERKQREAELRKVNLSLARAQQIAHLGSWETYLPTGELLWSDEMYRLMGYTIGTPLKLEEVIRGFPPEELLRFNQAIKAAIEKRLPYRQDYQYIRPDGQAIYIHDEGEVQYNAQGQAVWMFGTTYDITERKLAEEERKRQVKRLEALREIDKAVTGSLDLQISLEILLKQVLEQLKVDAADVLLYDPVAQSVTYAHGLGFNTRVASHTALPAGRGYAGQVVRTHEKMVINPLPEEKRRDETSIFFKEGFFAYIGLPLIAKSQVKGVLEIFHRSLLTLEPEWMDYLDLLTGQAAIAIDSIQMFENLQQANLELGMAYDTTIEGWSRALDLRDKETEGHSRRVMELTMRLAQAMGIDKEALVHVYRGALLHDIGKMGVPDGILLKPSELTASEWEKMRKHPVFAFDLLSPIPYLRNALDIPYCHHEKWDGTGYPRGLKGTQIPLAARIFAIVDVWDALCSDRAYRPAWPKEKAIAYIQEQSGRYFDPQVIEVFLREIARQ